MSDLSRAAPFFGEQVNELMTLIISVMSGAGLSGFASAEAGGETSLANSEPQPNDNSPSMPEDSNVDSYTLLTDRKKSSTDAEKKMPSQSTMALQSAKSLQGNHDDPEPSPSLLSVDRNVVVSPPNVATTSLSRSNKDAQSNMTKGPFVDPKKGRIVIVSQDARKFLFTLSIANE
jgi:hypothetical protein